VPSKQVLDIKILSCGGMIDLMSEMEAAFLVNSLGLFRNRAAHGRATPRANVSLVRAYTTTDFYVGASGSEDILHLICHADDKKLQTGNGKSEVTAAKFLKRANRGNLTLPQIVISTGCSFQSPDWRSALRRSGVTMVIASPHSVTPANLTAFDMAFYSALLSQVRRGKPTTERVKLSFDLANRHYKAIHAKGTPFASFQLRKL
jgi:hypothetical protein